MNADYFGHYYQHYYPTSTSYYLPQKIGNYNVTSEINNNWNNCTYTTNINTTLLNQEYQNESSTRLRLTELIDMPNNNMFSNQLSMEHLISNGYPVPLSTLTNIPTTFQSNTQSISNFGLLNNVNDPNISSRNEFN